MRYSNLCFVIRSRSSLFLVRSIWFYAYNIRKQAKHEGVDYPLINITTEIEKTNILKKIYFIIF